jgi:hypothetical protein
MHFLDRAFLLCRFIYFFVSFKTKKSLRKYKANTHWGSDIFVSDKNNENDNERALVHDNDNDYYLTNEN